MEAARLAAGSWTPGNPEPDGGAAPPRRYARRSPGGKQPSSGGSGFIVSRTGVVLTNNHVVDGCRELRVMRNEKPVGAALVAADPADDLAILRLPEPVADSAPLRGDIPVKPGETVVVVGFPLQGLLTSQASVTTGVVSRLAGPHDDAHQLQITAPGRYPRMSISRSTPNTPARCSIATECPTKPPPPTRRCRRRRSPNGRSSSPCSCNVSGEPQRRAPLLGAEEAISGVTEPREDVAVPVEATV